MKRLVKAEGGVVFAEFKPKPSVRSAPAGMEKNWRRAPVLLSGSRSGAVRPPTAAYVIGPRFVLGRDRNRTAVGLCRKNHAELGYDRASINYIIGEGTRIPPWRSE